MGNREVEIKIKGLEKRVKKLTGVIREKMNGKIKEKGVAGLNGGDVLRFSNSRGRELLEDGIESGYNEIDSTEHKQPGGTREESGEYSAKDTALEFIKDYVVTRRVVDNEAPVRIGVTGNKKKDDPSSFHYLYPGESSTKHVRDADGVVIQPGQVYYKPGTKEKVSSGVIKTPNWLGAARVVMDADGVMKVKGLGTEYYTEEQAIKEGWKIK